MTRNQISHVVANFWLGNEWLSPLEPWGLLAAVSGSPGEAACQADDFATVPTSPQRPPHSQLPSAGAVVPGPWLLNGQMDGGGQKGTEMRPEML